MKKFLIALAVVATAALTFQACQLLQPSFEAKNYDYSALKSPLKNVNVAFETVEVEAGEPKVVHFKNGSSLNVPKDAFVDANGNTISGKVSLNFRQFDDAADIIASGIPMTYKEADGKNQQLESGGMFELKGEANGQAVFIAPDKKIQTNIASSTPGAYDFYYLEPDAQTTGDQAYNWKKLTNDIDNVPTSKVKGLDSFQLKFNLETYPELEPFQNIQWQLSDLDPSSNPKNIDNQWVLKQNWNQIEISKPQYKVKKVKDLLQGHKYGIRFSVSPNGKEKIVHSDNKAVILEANGNIIKEVNIGSNNFFYYLSNNLILTWENNLEYSIRDNHLNLIKNIKHAYGISYSTKKNRIAYQLREYPNMALYCIDEKGKQVFKKVFEPSHLYSWSFYSGLSDESFFICSNDKIKIFDFDGNILNEIPNKQDYQIIRPLKEHYYYQYYYSQQKDDNLLWLEKENGEVEVWDWKKDKLYQSKGIDVRDKTPEDDYNRHANIYTHPKSSIATIREDGANKYKIWNWEKNTITESDFDFNYSPKGNFYYNYGASKGNVYKTDGTKIIDFDIDDAGELPQMIFYTEEEDFILVKATEITLYDKKGKLICNLSKEQKDLKDAVFTADFKTIIGYKDDGTFLFWNLQGKITHQFKINEYNFSVDYLALKDSLIITNHHTNKVWDFNGNLICDFGKFYPTIGNAFYYNYNHNYNYNLKNNPLVLLNHNGDNTSYNLYDVQTRVKDTNTYQLTMIKGDTLFFAYVYLDDRTLRLVEQYQIAKQAKIQQEKDRKETEKKLMRSFAINNFGIYNWDRFYKDENELLVRCTATFNFDLKTEYSSIDVFLITGENKNIVIRYYDGSFDKFNFNPTLYNKLIAILPDNKIAVFEDSDFKTLDANKIRQEKKHQFQMKILGGVEAMEELKKLTDVPT